MSEYMWNRIYRLLAVMSIAMMGVPSAFEAMHEL